jgi:hypothetical protein
MMMNKEEWRDIPDSDNRIMVSNFGRVVRNEYLDAFGKNHNSKLLKCSVNKSLGYRMIYTTINGKRYTRYVHRLVAMMFIKTDDFNKQVNHKDCDKANNHFENLEWVTKEENRRHAVRNGLVY